MNERIKEMAQEICAHCVETCGQCDIEVKPCETVMEEAEHLYNAVYRKQKEGEWKMLIYNKHCSCGKSQKVARYECSVCKRIADMQPYGLSFCPNCGAHMKGGAE